ncbi:hypothetical protein [Inquilinus limosus]|uniref:Antifreeze protein n=1 Tax=Inquilinus limosus TaxID=171674 RepID=A0A211ZRL5_9PROT|nr:hypothetical protein [Inquilinus limosus]OWJ67879.1 hypothetical protein BWR60_06625 [Inquilinus limosus]
MINQTIRNSVGALILATGAVFAAASPAQAATLQECSARYQAAQAAGKLDGMTWSDFRKAECSADVAPAAAPAAQASAVPVAAAKPAAAPAVPAAAGDAVFPPAVSSKYAAEPPARARMHTCRDQYNLNKTTKSNGGLRWIQTGGGYYSQCNARLKS